MFEYVYDFRRWVALAGCFLSVAYLSFGGMGLLPDSAWAKSKHDSDRIHCLDTSRRAVSLVYADDCRGEVISADNAAVLKQQRVRRIQSALAQNRSGMFPKRRIHHSGTGMILASDGLALTNAHVVSDCLRVSVADAEGNEAEAHLRKRHPVIDLAILATPLFARPAMVFRTPDSDFRPKRTDLIGYPYLGFGTERPQLAEGRPYDSSVLKNDAFHIFIEAAVRAGYSGGPVLDQSGLVIGLVFAQIDTPWYYNRTGQVLRDVGVAIPATAIIPFLEDAGISVRLQSEHPELTPLAAFRARKNSVIRVNCWR